MAKNKPNFAALSHTLSHSSSKAQKGQDRNDNWTAQVVAHAQGLVVMHREQLDAVRDTVDKARQSLAEGRADGAADLLDILSRTLADSVAKHDAAIREATAARALVGISDRMKQ